MLKRNKPPLLVVVDDGRWSSYGSPTVRNHRLTALLTMMGGISDTVPNGTYYFNVVRKGLYYNVSLDSAE